MKKLFTFLLVCFIANTYAQTALTGYAIVNNTATASSNSSNGWNAVAPFPTSTTYTNFYGQKNGGAAGIERTVTGFTIGALSYTAVPRPGGLPYDNIVINRHPLMVGDTINTLYEYTAGTGNNHYYEASYAGTLDGVINSLVCNRGSDNTFSNSPTTQANIERVDQIITAGIVCTDPAKQGFLVNERNGNDAFKVTAITSLSAGNVNTLGSLVSIAVGNWGVVGPNFVSRVMSKKVSDPFLMPKQDIASQTVSGVFISFADLGIGVGATCYGLSVFPNDVTAAMNLLTLANVPTNTDAGANGGLDMMAGGGFFVENSLLAVNLTSFNGAVSGSDINLSWQTNNEINFSRFELERSLNEGTRFETVASFTAKNTAVANYSFQDLSAAQRNSKTYLYRLKMIDIDGSFTYSKILAFKFSKTASIKVFPTVLNRAQTFNIQITDNETLNNYDVSIYDMQARTVKTITRLKNGQYPVNSAEFAPGTYLVKVASGNNFQTIKIIIQ